VLGRWSISLTLKHSNQLTTHTFYYKYRIFWGGNSSNSRNIFTLQKKVVRIMAGTQPRTSCRSPFKQLEILPSPCQYILPIMNVIVNNQAIFHSDSSIHSVNIRKKQWLVSHPAVYMTHIRIHGLYVYTYECTYAYVLYMQKKSVPHVYTYECTYSYICMRKTIPHTFLRILCHAKSLFVNQGVLVTFQLKPTGIHDTPRAHYTSQVCLMSWRWLLWQTSDSVGLRAAKVMCALCQET